MSQRRDDTDPKPPIKANALPLDDYVRRKYERDSLPSSIQPSSPSSSIASHSTSASSPSSPEVNEPDQGGLEKQTSGAWQGQAARIRGLSTSPARAPERVHDWERRYDEEEERSLEERVRKGEGEYEPSGTRMGQRGEDGGGSHRRRGISTSPAATDEVVRRGSREEGTVKNPRSEEGVEDLGAGYEGDAREGWYEADGIVRRSERNEGKVKDSRTAGSIDGTPIPERALDDWERGYQGDAREQRNEVGSNGARWKGKGKARAVSPSLPLSRSGRERRMERANSVEVEHVPGFDSRVQTPSFDSRDTLETATTNQVPGLTHAR
ncbi:hypothetical protein NMY22_g9994 [Coprinellus aureogranulatus]|nr:hypothetical protein NMY22_g9994 [Coprinellus aureogranulatus]